MIFFLKWKNVRLLNLLSMSLFFCAIADGQMKLSVKYFESSTWASNNKDSCFFKSDTIKIIRIVKNVSFQASESKDVAGYFNGNDFITLEFGRANKLNLFVTKVESWSITKRKGKYSWDFNNKNQILSLYFNGKLFATFKSISKREVMIASQYVDQPQKTTIEIIMKRGS